MELTEVQREARRVARKAERRRTRIRNAHERASRFSESSLTEAEKSALRERDMRFHGVETDAEGLAFIAFARNDEGARLEAMGTSPEDAVSRLVAMASR